MVAKDADMNNFMKSIASIAILLSLTACAASGSQPPSANDGGGTVPTSGSQQADNEPFLPFSGLEQIELLTPTSGVGEKPLFEWSAAPGASSYALFLYFSDGNPYWAWSGESTSIYLGGYASAPPADAAGPILVDGMTWAVIAFDASENVIASSEKQPISP
jgi:hypothetical protein